jgi:hypothetical protein
MGRHRRHIAPAELDPAAVRALETGDQPQQGRLPRARWTEQGEELALVDGQVDSVDRDDMPVILANAVESQRRRLM